MKALSKIASAVTAVALAAGICAVPLSADAEENSTGMRDITTAEIVKEMGIGINLGNTFESCGDWINGSTVTAYETAWGSPVITQEMIQGIADEDFGVLRIPVAWSNMMDFDNDYQINSQYMERVKEVTDWAVDAGMYVIINIHWDGGWWEKFPTEKDECMHRYTRMWQQICDGFAEYDDHVMFESLNEEGGWSSLWNQYNPSDTENKQKSYDLLNEINQTFVDLVRSQDNNNAQRHLLIAGYVTDVDLTCDEMFKMPNDPLNRCAVSVHYYTPSSFAIAEEGTTWTTPKTVWGTLSDYSELNTQMEKLKTRFTDNGVPVIVGECACASRLNKADGECRRYNLACVAAMYDNGLCPVIWDVTMGEDNDETIYSIYSRKLCKLGDEKFKEGLEDIKTKQAVSITVGESFPKINGTDDPVSLNAQASNNAHLTYKSNDNSIALVDKNGMVYPVSKGVTQIVVTAEGDDNYRSTELLVPIRVLSDNPNPVTEDYVNSIEEINNDNNNNDNTETPSDEPTDEPADEPTDEPADEPTDEPSEQPADAANSDNSNKASNSTTSNPSTGTTITFAAIAAAAALMVSKKKR